jgi:hypothetical protein
MAKKREAIRSWAIEEIKTSDEETESGWDQYRIGLVEDGTFRMVYTAESSEDASKLKAALEWYESWIETQTLSLCPPPKPARKRR